jgi:HlyD family secretion protein
VISIADGAYPGAAATPLSPVIKVVNPGTVYFSAEADEMDVTKLKIGQKVIVELDAYPNQTFDSVISEIEFGNTLTSTGGTAYKVKVLLPENSEDRFRLGMNGNAEFVLNTRDNVLLVPSTAVIENNGKNYVWEINGTGSAKRVEVIIGDSSIDQTEIKSGLAEGEVIIQNPPTQIKNGDKVKAS